MTAASLAPIRSPNGQPQKSSSECTFVHAISVSQVQNWSDCTFLLTSHSVDRVFIYRLQAKYCLQSVQDQTMAFSRVLPSGVLPPMFTLLLLISVLSVFLLHPAQAEEAPEYVEPILMDYVLQHGEWVPESAFAATASASRRVTEYDPSCGPCNMTRCALKQPQKCKGVLEWDRCGCCQVCVKPNGKRCQPKRRPCQSGQGLHCLPDESGVKRCQQSKTKLIALCYLFLLMFPLTMLQQKL